MPRRCSQLKPVGARGPLRTSDAPTAITDLPATLLDLAELPNTLRRGASVLALDPATPRERTYAHHEWGRRNDWASPYLRRAPPVLPSTDV